MSERGSFVTQYIYCAKCFKAAKAVLDGKDKYLYSIIVGPPDGVVAEGSAYPIIAGKIGGGYLGEELHTFDTEFNPKLAALICHPLRIAVLADQGEAIFVIRPRSETVCDTPT